jgi:hypothetical protein
MVNEAPFMETITCTYVTVLFGGLIPVIHVILLARPEMCGSAVSHARFQHCIVVANPIRASVAMPVFCEPSEKRLIPIEGDSWLMMH